MNLRDHLVPMSACPYCGYRVNAAGETPDGDTRAPEPGDFSVCISCAGIVAFADDMTLRKASLVETQDQELAAQLLKVRAAVLKAKSQDPSWPKKRP